MASDYNKPIIDILNLNIITGKDFVKDIKLYICKEFGYRNSVYMNPTCNGCCIHTHEKGVKLYFRLWEHSNGVDGFPDRCIIMVNHAFEKNYR